MEFGKPESYINNLIINGLYLQLARWSCRLRGRRAAAAAAPSPAFHSLVACSGRQPACPAKQIHKDITPSTTLICG
jgi:hypothetical protein